MNKGVSKAQDRRSRARLSKRLQEELLNAVATDLPRDGSASTKRHLDEVDQPPAKKARLSNTHQHGAQPINKVRQHTDLQDQASAASFLEEFVDPVQTCFGTDSEHSFVLEWLESVGSDRDTRCLSDSHLYLADGSPPRQLTRSAPAMTYRLDSTGSRSRAGTDDRLVAHSDVSGSTPGSSRRSLLEGPFYRRLNLAANNIYMRPLHDQFPKDIDDIVRLVQQDRDSPVPSLEDVRQNIDLNELFMGAGEPIVEEYFRHNIFPNFTASESLDRAYKQPMVEQSVPQTTSQNKVSTPVPDMLYGYNPGSAFPNQQAQLLTMGTEPIANTEGLLYPFFVIEFTGDGPGGAGSLWLATNQCLGGSASCVNIAERLNTQLRRCNSDNLINSAAFSIAMNGTEARLYVSWKHNEQDYYMANVRNFLLQDPKHYIEFRKYVRNIIDWGRGLRLEEIRKSLDLEESGKRASAAAKS
ncbi:hypothetical protein ACQKWADRAFT_302048 [Trichoderma austrokoningii]